MNGPKLCQIAMCSGDVPRTARIYSEGLGFANSGGRLLWGERISKIQGLDEPDLTASVWWAVGRQDLMQIEFFEHTRPPQRPQPEDWRPSDHGWVRWGAVVPDFDAAVERLGALGVETLTAAIKVDGLRRVCFKEPAAQVIVELFEEGADTPGGIRPRFYDLVPAVVYATVSVADLDQGRRFFLDTLALEEDTHTVLHTPEHETLWGLEGALCESFLVRTDDVWIEVVRYDDPPGRPKPDGYRLSDQGFMNVAVGFRDGGQLRETYERVLANGYTATAEAPTDGGGTYLYDDQGTSLELMISPRELDERFGFVPQPVYRHPQVWPQAHVGPAE